MTATDSGPRPIAQRGRRPLLIVGVVVGVLLVLATMLYLNRRAATRQLLVGWLEQQGIAAEMHIERVELDGLVASVRIGEPGSPDVTVERVEVDFAIGTPWSEEGLGLTPTRVRLVRPVVRASVRNGKLTLGSLDPLVERFAGRPPRPDSRGPLVLVEGAQIRLDTDYGPTRIFGDVRIDDGKLMRLTARMPQTVFTSGAVEATGLHGTLDLTTTGDRVALRLAAAAERASLSGIMGEGTRLTLSGDLPYPDLKTRRGDGRARIYLHLTAARLAAADGRAQDADLNLAFNGRTAGWLESFRIDGTGTARLSAARVDGPTGSMADMRMDLSANRTVLARESRGLNWRLDGNAAMTVARASGAELDGAGIALSSRRLVLGGRGTVVEAEGPVAVSADRLAWADLSLTDLRGLADFDLVSDGGVRIAATGKIRSAGGAWPLFGAPLRGDVTELAGLKRALSDFALDVPGFELATGGSGTRLTLTRPATLRPANGGTLTARPVSTPIFTAGRGQAAGGALSLEAIRGQGLPDAVFAIPDWRLTANGFTARLEGRAALDFGLARGITIRTGGELRSGAGRLTYLAAGCSPFAIERLELDESDVVDVAGDICALDRTLVSVAQGRWRADGALRHLNASAPFLALQFRDADGGFAVTGGPAGLGLEARVARATVEDAITPHRFNSLTATGTAGLSGEDWTGVFDLARGDTDLGHLTLSHDGAAGIGGLKIDAPSIVFAAGGLQPVNLSPMAEIIGAPASGSVAFEGRVDWRAGAEGRSSGRLTIPGLDFASPAGPVKGLRGTVDFSNLAPLTAVPGQRLAADRLETFVPLTDIGLTFGLDRAAVTIEGGDLAVAGGHMRVEPFSVSLDPNEPVRGVIVLENVQLGQVIAGSGFGEKVNLDAVVSGRLPFTSDRVNGVRIVGGSLAAVQPGRLSIAREALSGLEAGGGGEAVPPNMVQDLAYQAMENLAFDILSAEVNSLDEGRIGVLFRIRGRHDPPVRQELRIPLAEFISREFLNRILPLPSGTGIDLSLDTTLNLNQLIGDLLAMNRARGGQPTVTP